MNLTPTDHALAEGFAGPQPFEIEINRGQAQPVRAAHAFDAVDAAIDAGAARVECRAFTEAELMRGDLANNVDKAGRKQRAHEDRAFKLQTGQGYSIRGGW